MIAAMVRQFRRVAGEIGLTEDLHRTVTLASIIEKETSVADERPEVASVYQNRLNGRIPLQADPHVIYAELLQGSYSGALHHDDMSFDSAYNTYRHIGLPAGPDCEPGEELAASGHASWRHQVPLFRKRRKRAPPFFQLSGRAHPQRCGITSRRGQTVKQALEQPT